MSVRVQRLPTAIFLAAWFLLLSACGGSNDNGRPDGNAGTGGVITRTGGTGAATGATGGSVSGGTGTGGLPTGTPIRTQRLASSQQANCVVQADQTPYCWGSPAPGFGSEPVQHIDGGGNNMCGLCADGIVECWHPGEVASGVPAGEFVDLGVSGSAACALNSSGTVTCWGQTDSLLLAAPPGAFSDITVNTGVACGFLSAGGIQCWGDPAILGGTLEPPRDDFTAIYIGVGVACGIYGEGYLECWPEVFAGNHPTGNGYVQVAVGGTQHCALHGDGHVDCWGGEAPAPPAGVTFVEVSAGESWFCGITTSGTIECWGEGGTPAESPAGIRAF